MEIKEGRVLLFDSNDVKVGETFLRRARQLVGQQRAEWIDDSHSAIRFFPDFEKWERKDVHPTTITTSLKDEWIYSIAEKRIHERKMFRLHTLGLIPGYIVLIILSAAIESAGFGFFTCGAWTMAYAIHVFFYVKVHKQGYRSPNYEARRARKLAEEVDRLKRMGYDSMA